MINVREHNLYWKVSAHVNQTGLVHLLRQKKSSYQPKERKNSKDLAKTKVSQWLAFKALDFIDYIRLEEAGFTIWYSTHGTWVGLPLQIQQSEFSDDDLLHPALINIIDPNEERIPIENFILSF